MRNGAIMRGCAALLALACLGMATTSWAEQCEGSASTCASSADAVPPPAAPPDIQALLEAHSRSRKALATPKTIEQQQPRLREDPVHYDNGTYSSDGRLG